MAGQRRQWLRNVVAYTLGGAVTSAAVGASIGYAGHLALPRGASAAGLWAVLAVCAAVIVRELRWNGLPLLQAHHQTSGSWIKIVPPTTAATLWGMEIGLTLTTWLTFAGVWAIASVVFVLSSPTFGVLLLSAHWIGRVAPVWIAPLLITEPRQTEPLGDLIRSRRRSLQLIHVGATAALALSFLTHARNL